MVCVHAVCGGCEPWICSVPTMHTGRASSLAKERFHNRARNWNREHSLCIHRKCWQPSKLALCSRTLARWCTRPIPVTAIHVTKEAQQIAFARCIFSLHTQLDADLACCKDFSFEMFEDDIIPLGDLLDCTPSRPRNLSRRGRVC